MSGARGLFWTVLALENFAGTAMAAVSRYSSHLFDSRWLNAFVLDCTKTCPLEHRSKQSRLEICSPDVRNGP